jgi:hypothetical protein
LALDDIPDCISTLNDQEVALITQVKAFMKIILLNNGKGQKAMKGMAVHFPQEVEEVIEQLPLHSSKADVIFVIEEHEGSDFTRQLEVSPAKLVAALEFLKANNPLYANIEILNRNESEMSPIVIMNNTNDQNEELLQSISGMGYASISTTTEILRGTLHQGHTIFSENAGKQCTAMTAAFFAYACIEGPRTWFREKVDNILAKGNRYYSEKRPFAEDDFLQVEEIAGTFYCFTDVGVKIEPIPPTNLTNIYEGYLNKIPNNAMPRLPDHILNFINSEYNYATIQVNSNSMGNISRKLKICLCLNLLHISNLL